MGRWTEETTRRDGVRLAGQAFAHGLLQNIQAAVAALIDGKNTDHRSFRDAT